MSRVVPLPVCVKKHRSVLGKPVQHTQKLVREVRVLGSTDPRDVMSLTWKPHIFIEEGRRPLIPFFAKDTVRKTKMDSLTAIETLYQPHYLEFVLRYCIGSCGF